MSEREMPKVFGIGWAKTGTTTLGHCFKILGYKHQSQRLDLVQDIKEEDLRRIREVAAQKESFEDWPWILLFRELDEMFPGSKFVLTVRDPERWVRSYTNMLRTQSEASEELNEIRRILYNLPFPDVSKWQLVQRYIRHNREVKQYFSGRPEDLIVVNWEEGDGWEELCSFLGKDLPSEDFPHKNEARYAHICQIKYYFQKIIETVRLK